MTEVRSYAAGETIPKRDRPLLTCGQCNCSWYQANISRQPQKCPACSTTFWRLPKDFMLTAEARRARLLKAARDVLIGNDTCHFGRPPAGELLALTPYMARRWQMMPALYGALLNQTCSRKDCEEVVTELTKPLIHIHSTPGSDMT